MQAHLLTLNEFSQPKVLSASDAGYVNLVYLIMLTKGKYQSHPTMGVGIRERYRNNNSSTLVSDLKNDITYQIETFLPEVTFTNVSITLKNNTLGIAIDTVDGTYAMAYDASKDSMDVAASYVLDDL